MLAEFQQTCECFSAFLYEKDSAVVAGPEMKSEKTEAAQFLKATKQK